MTSGQSRPVTSSQDGPHPRLLEIVRRHQKNRSQRPIAPHNQAAFETLKARLEHADRFILDSCCGVGDSSRSLAQQFPEHLVVGVDQSADRLTRTRQSRQPDNLLLLRADLEDLLPLLRTAALRPAAQYLLYPNPWPKPGHVQRRWHAMSCFVDLVALGGAFEARSNWRLYLEEMQIALGVYGIEAVLAPLAGTPASDFDGLTAFETKYARSGQPLWRLTAVL